MLPHPLSSPKLPSLPSLVLPPVPLRAPVQVWPVALASPAGLAIVGDAIYVAALRGTRLWRMKITGNTTTASEEYFTGAYGRLRTVEASPDGGLWLATSNGGDKDSVPNNSATAILHVALNRRH